jgi:hypothetical protein
LVHSGLILAFSPSVSRFGHADRRAFGFETRYFVPGRTYCSWTTTFSDQRYSVSDGQLGAPGRWVLARVDRRRTPVLMLPAR